MTNRLTKALIGIVLFIPLLVFVGDFGAIYFEEVPNAPQIQAIYNNKVTLFTIALVCGGIVMFLVIYLHLKNSSRERAEPIRPGWNRSMFMVFIAFVVMTMVVTVLVSGGTLAEMGRAPSAVQGPNAATTAPQHLEVRVIAHQWAWKFHYNNPNVGDKYTFRAPAGTYVHVNVVSQDVAHSFSMQALGIKVDAIPGQENSYWFKTPAEPGTYQINCAELCGSGHSQMKASFVVMPKNKFASWASQNGGNFTATSEGGD
ncbi:MAG: cytochrome c oxidase subunit II [Salinigranum sp.]